MCGAGKTHFVCSLAFSVGGLQGTNEGELNGARKSQEAGFENQGQTHFRRSSDEIIRTREGVEIICTREVGDRGPHSSI